MTNLEFAQDAVKDLDFSRRNSIDNYLLGILSVVVSEPEWHNAIKTAIDLEAKVHASMHPEVSR